jgi:hypothetical protein
VGPTAEAAEASVVVLVVHSLLHQLQVVGGQGQLQGSTIGSLFLGDHFSAKNLAFS